MSIELSGYYNRFDPDKHYEKHLFRASYVLQSAEMNEIQEAGIHRVGSMGDALFKDGDIIRDARVIVDSVTGETTCESGAVYLRGAVRGVPPATITIPVNRTVSVGIYLVETTITQNEDPDLRDPADETRNYQEPGASRLKVEPVWGYDQSGLDGEFFPIYEVDNGIIRAKEPPPVMDGVSQAIARYDRDSAGSNYIVEGLKVAQLDDLLNGHQVYNIENGRARVNGFGVTMDASRRLEYPAVPDLRFIDSEPFTSATAGTQRVNVDRSPISEITQVRITEEKTVTLSHGTFVGAQDPLPDSSVVDLVEVKQGATVYVKGTDYKLTSGRVDWSLGGDEPAPGSSYDVTYHYIRSVTPTDIDDTGFTVTGAVPSTLILTNYHVKLPRIDRLCLSEGGEFVWVRGVSTDYNPVRPKVPKNLCPIASVVQTWTDDRRVVNDGVRVVPMSDIEAMNFRMDNITDLVAQQKLVSDLSVREQAAMKGLFVDPFLDDVHRDQGIAQTAASFDGILTLGIDGEALRPNNDVDAPATCAFVLEPILRQELRTGSMKINPYMAFGIPPAQVTLVPAVDHWTEVDTQWASPVTKSFHTLSPRGGGVWRTTTTSSTTDVLLKTEQTEIEHLRQIDVEFHIAGFGPGETLDTVTFDGLTVIPTAM